MAFITKKNIKNVGETQYDAKLEELKQQMRVNFDGEFDGGIDIETSGLKNWFDGVATEDAIKKLQEEILDSLKIPKDRLISDANITPDPSFDRFAKKIAANSFYGSTANGTFKMPEQYYSAFGAPVLSDKEKIINITPDKLWSL